MPATDATFGPPLIHGPWRCPDCGAGPDQLCHWYCPRYADDPGDGPSTGEDDDDGC